ncbi:MAG: hypothetical protein ABIJ92_00145 [Candidatus Aenigmatarchaeota archaeon]
MSKPLKGQSEAIIIIGILVVVAVVVVLAMGPSLIPEPQVPVAVQQDQRVVKDFVETMVQSKAVETIMLLESNGGYLPGDPFLLGNDLPVSNNRKIPYWQRCENGVPPQLNKEMFVNRINERIAEDIAGNLSGITDIRGKEVEFNTETISVETQMHNDKIDIVVTMNTNVEGYRIREPFTVNIPTHFSRILDFATDFSNDQAHNRHFETFTRFDIDFFTDLPRAGFMVTCGDNIFVEPEKISEKLEGVVNNVVLNTKLWDDTYVENGILIHHGIEDVNGRTYQDLERTEEIRMLLPFDFSIRTLEPIVLINMERLITSSTFSIPSVCVGRYVQNYSVSFPVIIRVYDDLLDNYFYFANFAYVDNNENGVCQGPIEAVASCSDLQCTASLTVRDGDGNPLENVPTYIGGCLVGKTDQNGMVQGASVCGDNTLTVFESSEREFVNKQITVNNVYQEIFNLHKIPDLEFNFVQTPSLCNLEDPVDSEFVIMNLTSKENGETYIIANNQPAADSACMDGSGATAACQSCSQNPQDQSSCSSCISLSSGCLKTENTPLIEISFIPSGSYTVNTLILNMRVLEENYERYPFVSIPVPTADTDLVIPEKNSHINIEIPETDEIYAEAIRKYDDTVDYYDGRCRGGNIILGCLAGHYTRGEAEALGLEAATEYIIDNIQSTSATVCS